MMKKKGQFYIFTAIILCAIVLGLAAPISVVNAPTKNFEYLYKNYIYESTKAVNSAIYDDENISTRLDGFTDDFLAYAATKDRDFSLFYILVDNNDIYINSYMDEELEITAGGSSLLLKKGSTSINRTDEVSIRLRKRAYDFEITEEPVQLKALFRTEKGSTVRIYVEDDSD